MLWTREGTRVRVSVSHTLQGHTEIMEMLFLEDTDIQLRDAEGRSVLHVAAMGGHAQACALTITLIAK